MTDVAGARPCTPPGLLTREASGLDKTPCESAERRAFRYYCPLCMMHFGAMRKAACCGQYLCMYCEKDLHAQADEAMRTTCPYCSHEDFTIEDVLDTDVVRDYSDSPALKKASSSAAHDVSPVATGASIEELRRKLVPLPKLPPMDPPRAAKSHPTPPTAAVAAPSLPPIRKAARRPKLTKSAKPLEPQRHFVETDWCGCGGSVSHRDEENAETSSVCVIS
eukprot:TRINITY_DN1151_c0_g2_i1.p1 TRINITY_DN1151_c0_g2~~TRINITY_DN1151_c0_g2_i1.p1  ORF type:complete len:221 (+),score=73.73 TRINITY_DN1151_c0_g2_i1:60-722(+)